jgi:hypothetical protein
MAWGIGGTCAVKGLKGHHLLSVQVSGMLKADLSAISWAPAIVGLAGDE